MSFLMFTRKHGLWGLLVVVGLLGLLVLRLRPSSALGHQVDRGPVRMEIRGTGTLEAAQEVPVAFRVAGRILDLAMQEGTLVREGQVLGRLEPSEAERQLRVAQAGQALSLTGVSRAQGEVEHADATRERAKADLDRIRSLAGLGIISRADLDAAVERSRMAEAQSRVNRDARHRALDSVQVQAGAPRLLPGIGRSLLGGTSGARRACAGASGPGRGGVRRSPRWPPGRRPADPRKARHLQGCPEQGRITLAGQEVVGDGTARVDLPALRRNRIGFVFQKSNLIPFLTAQENVRVALKIRGGHSRPPHAGSFRHHLRDGGWHPCPRAFCRGIRLKVARTAADIQPRAEVLTKSKFLLTFLGMMEPGLHLTPKQLEIADAALRIIGKQGISALTTATLAAELGVSNGAPFRHFANREEILEAVAFRVEELIIETLPDCSGPALDRIRQLFLARTKAVGRHAGIARLMFSDQLSMALPKPAAIRLRSLVARTRSFLLEALKEAAAGGEIRSDLAPEALLPIVMGTLQHLVFARSLGLAKDGETDDVSATLINLLAPCSLPHFRGVPPLPQG